MTETCPVCSTPVRVITGGEGTSHYEVLAEERLSALITATKISESQAEAACREVIYDLEAIERMAGAAGSGEVAAIGIAEKARHALAAARKGAGDA